jgi:hypothetical protein
VNRLSTFLFSLLTSGAPARGMPLPTPWAPPHLEVAIAERWPEGRAPASDAQHASQGTPPQGEAFLEEGEKCLGKDEERLGRGCRWWRASVDGWGGRSWGTGHRPAPEPLRQVASQGMGGALRGRARPERPWAAVFSLRREGHQSIAQRLGLLRHGLDLACAVLRFVGLETLLDVGTAVV